MLKKSSKTLFFIPPEILFYLDLKSLNFFFFGTSGWYLKKLLKKETFLYSACRFLIRSFFVSSLLFNNLIFGLIKSYFKYIQLRGRSFKYIYFFSNLVIRFGFSHKIYYIIPNNSLVSLVNKQVLKISGKSLQQLKRIFFDFYSIRKFDKYKGKGLLYYNDVLILKASSKKTKV